jgi:hypothetical protein
MAEQKKVIGWTKKLNDCHTIKNGWHKKMDETSNN